MMLPLSDVDCEPASSTCFAGCGYACACNANPTTCGSGQRPKGRGQVQLLLTNHAHNKSVRPSPSRHYPFRGLSAQTSRRVFSNADAINRILCEFSKIQDVSALRKTSPHLKGLVDEHSMLWRNVQFSPPGLCRSARSEESAASMEKFLRKGAEDGNIEAQMMLALLYHLGYRCPCHPLAIPGCF